MQGSVRVLFVNHASNPAGAEGVLLRVARSFDTGSSVLLFSPGPFMEQLEAQGVRVLVASNGDFSDIRRDSSLLRQAVPAAGRLARIVEKIARAARRHDVIYANSQKAFVLSAFAAPLARRPLVWHLHDILSAAHFAKPQIKLDVLLANRFAAAVVTPSAAAARAFVEAGGRPALIHVVHNGMAPPLTLPTIDHHAWREELGLAGGFLYGSFSRLARWKGQHVALAALAHLPPSAHYLCVGSAQFGEEDYEAELHALALRAGVQNRVLFLGHRTDVAQLMQIVDAYVHPSIAADPFPLAVLEAMWSALPIVAAADGGIPEMIEDEQTGLLFPSGDAVTLACKLAVLADDPAWAKRLGEQAANRAAEDFTEAAMIAKIHRIITNLVSRQGNTLQHSKARASSDQTGSPAG